MANRATIPRNTARTFRADIAGAIGTETIKLVVAAANPTSFGVIGSLVKALTWDPATPGTANPAGTFFCLLTATDNGFAVGNYFACVWRTDGGNEDVPIAPGQFVYVDNPRAA